MRSASFVFALLAPVGISHAEERVTERTFAWGSLWVVAGSTDSARVSGSPKLVFEHDVRADLRFGDGRRSALAAGRVELDPATGNFLATRWPFLAVRNGSSGSYHRLNGVSEKCV